MPVKVSPLRVVVESCKKLIVRPKRNLVLLLLLAGFAYLDEVVPPDPIIWLVKGVPLLILVTPIEVLAFRSLLPTTCEAVGLVPDNMLRKCALFFLWSCLFSVLSNSAFWAFVIALPAVSLGTLLALVVESSLAFQIANVLALGLGELLIVVVIWFLITRALMFPGIVAGAAHPFSEAGRMIKGSFWRFCLSFVLLLLPVVAALVLLDNLGPGGELPYDMGFTARVVAAVLEAVGDMLCFSGLCVWYGILRLRAADPETDSGNTLVPATAPAGPVDPRAGSGVGPYADLPGE